MESVLCEICERDKSQLVYKVQDTNYGCPGTFDLVQCTDCGLVYQNPRPTSAEFSKYYPVEQYHPFKALREKGVPRPGARQTERAQLLTEKIGPGPVLDVGCGSGLFLAAMRQLNWQCRGVEPHKAAAQYAREILRLQVETGDIFSVEDSAAFKLITFWDVLEHTHSPRSTLSHARKILRTSGYLAINVPNWASLERRVFHEKWIAVDAPRHLYHFTPQTLVKMLSICGFTPESVKASAPPLSLSSNVLRWLGDTFLRKGQAKALMMPSSSQASSASVSTSRRILIGLIRQAMNLPNAVLNSLNLGSGITVIARKA